MIKVAQFSDLHFSGKNLDEAGRCFGFAVDQAIGRGGDAVSYKHLRAHETGLDLVCRLLSEKKKTETTY